MHKILLNLTNTIFKTQNIIIFKHVKLRFQKRDFSGTNSLAVIKTET